MYIILDGEKFLYPTENHTKNKLRPLLADVPLNFKFFRRRETLTSLFWEMVCIVPSFSRFLVRVYHLFPVVLFSFIIFFLTRSDVSSENFSVLRLVAFCGPRSCNYSFLRFWEHSLVCVCSVVSFKRDRLMLDINWKLKRGNFGNDEPT